MGVNGLRRFLLIAALSLVVLAVFPQSVFAKSENGCTEVMSEEMLDAIAKYKKEDANLVESYSVDIISSLWNIAGINSMSNLVFGNPYCVWNDDDTKLYLGIFPKEYKEKILDPVINLLTGSFVFILVLSMLISSIKLGFGFLSRSAIEDFGESVMMWLVVALLLSSYWLIIPKFIELNSGVVGAFKWLLEHYGISIDTSTMVASAKEEFNFSDIIVILAEWLLMLLLNFVYVTRIVMITLLLFLGILAIMSLMYRSTRFFFGTWLRELTGAVFIQSVHALLITIILISSSMTSGEMSVFYKMGLLILFLPLSSMIFSWTGLSSASFQHSMGMTGVNTIAASAYVARRIGNLSRQRRVPKQPNKGTDVGKTKISAGASGNYSKGWQDMKKVAGLTGSLVGGAAGTVLGPAGVALGAAAGGKLGAGSIQGMRNMASGLYNTRNTWRDARNTGLRNTLSNIQSRRQFMGNMGESLGSMVGLGSQGRKVGHAFSGVSRQRLLNSMEMGGFGGQTLQELQTQFPGAHVSWHQDNMGSAFYMQDSEGQLKQISPFGEADPSLNNGEMRKVDFQFQESAFAAQDGMYQASQVMHSSPLTRTSGAYVEGLDGAQYQDSRFNPETISPDSYFVAGMGGADVRDFSDRVADRVGGFVDSFNHNQEPRHRGFV